MVSVQGIGRRGLLVGMAGVGGLATLAGCGGSSGPSATKASGRKPRWSARLLGSVDFDASGQPYGLALDGATLYVGQAGRLTALHAGTGKQKWQSPHGPTQYSTAGTQFTDAAPQLADDVVLVVDNHPAHAKNNTPGALHAIDASTGKKRWTFRSPAGKLATPAAADGVVCVADPATVYLVDAATGQVKASEKIKDGVGTGRSAMSDGAAVFVDGGGAAVALDVKTRKVRWVASVRAPTDSAVVIGSGVVYLGAQVALDLRTGKPWWQDGQVDTGLLPVSVSADGTLFTAGTQGFGGDSTKISAVDATSGTTVWQAGVPGDDTSAYGPPAVLGDRVYAGTSGSGLLALDAASGKRRWRLEVGAAPVGPPVAAGHTVYAVVGNDSSDDDRDKDNGGWDDVVYALPA